MHKEATLVEIIIEEPRFSFLKRDSTGGLDFISPFPCPPTMARFLRSSDWMVSFWMRLFMIYAKAKSLLNLTRGSQ